ncbi:hypothetical protein ABWR82_003712 [Salmonella enterica subsp. enterica]|nr:hypothetical protein [Salmonella enterica subsp. enterica]EKS4618590.1 hypothetical protein [Salmonella enterica]EKS4944500.1 hypothetical protein [Salmonella enterica]
MRIIKFIAGSNFLSLLNGGIVPRRTGNKDIRTNRSLTELDDSVSNAWFKCIFPGVLCMLFMLILFLILYVSGTGMILQFYDVSTESGAVLSFSFIVVMSLFIGAIPVTIGRGNIISLFLILGIYIVDVLLTIIGISCMTIQALTYHDWRQLNLMPFQIIICFLCRYIMNSGSFFRMILFYHEKNQHGY